MLGKVKSVKKLSNLLQYMDLKVQQGMARTIAAENFIKDVHELNKDDIAYRFRQRTSLNDRCQIATKHFIVTFHPSDELSDALMSELAKKYLTGAGFGEQPYAIYRHPDTAHPNAHVVTTHVREDGTCIELSPQHIRQLHRLTKELEVKYGLKPGRSWKADELEQFKVTQARRVYRDGSSLKRAVSDVLYTVIDHYNYTTMDELNAVLRRYNVIADGGREGTQLYERRGMVYPVLNDEGQQISRGLNASLFGLRPTRNYLEKKFALNESLREYSRQRVQTAIDWVLKMKKPDWAGFQEALQREGIAIVQQDSKDGKEVYFVDHREKAAFRGSDLGMQYGLRALQERTAQHQRMEIEEMQRQTVRLRL